MGYVLHISPQEIERHATAILKPVKFGENGIGLCYPGCFIGYTVHALIESPTILRKYLGPYFRKYFLIPIELTAGDTRDTLRDKARAYIVENSDHILLPQTNSLTGYTKAIVAKGLDPYFFLLNAHVVTKDSLTEILNEFHTLVTDIPRCGVTVFTEANMFDDTWTRLLNTYHRFQHTTHLFPVFSEKESLSFIKTLARTWRMDMPDKTARMIVDLCGGYLWMLREAVRYVRDGNTTDREEILMHSRIRERATYIFNILDQRTKDGLVMMCAGAETDVPADIRKYLQSTGVVSQQGDSYVPTCPMFSGLLTKQTEVNQLTLSDGVIMYRSRPIEHVFSPSELAILKALAIRRGSILPRDSIATILWGKDAHERYSDWAIDKTMSRIRKILHSIGVPKHALQTRKKQGFILL